MRIPSLLTSVLIVGLAIPEASEAQSAKPDANTIALGADVGFLAPDNGTGSSPLPPLPSATGSAGAFVEYYYTDRTSVRATYGWASPAFEATPARSLRRQHLNVNFVYNWELGRFRPFATIGGGTYFLDRREDGEQAGRSIAKPGGSLGWGGEYYLRTFAVRSEMNVHILGDEKDFPELTGNTLTAFTWMFGIKVPF